MQLKFKELLRTAILWSKEVETFVISRIRDRPVFLVKGVV